MAGTTRTSATPQAAPAAKPRTASVRKQTPPARSHSAAPGRAAPPAVRLSAGAPAAKLNGLPGTSGGAPLAPEVRAPVEGSFGINLEAVRVHTNADARATAESLSARALTFGNHIFLGPGERATDTRLIAHEAAHVIQQQGGAAVQRWSAGAGDSFEREAHRASDAAAGGVAFTIRERTSAAKVQRLGISDALDYFADAANAIPGYRMFTVVIGLNPINMSPVARSAANIMRAVVEFIPGGNLVTRALDTYGIFDKVGNWVEQQIRALGMVGSAFRDALMEFLNSLGWRDIFRLGSVWDRAKRIFTAPVRQLMDFAGGLITGILGFLREAVLKPLARLAEGTRGYDLLKAVLGQDPVTGEPVPQNADTLIGGFMKLIGQEEVWQNIKKANAIDRAWAWFQGALSGVLAFVRAVPGLIISTLQSITLEDLLPITNLFVKVGRAFGGFIGSFISWAGGQVMSLLEIIFDVVAPSVMPYIRKAMGAFRTIIRNPIGFVGNLVRAGKQGFQQFAGNFLNHLRRSLIEWLTGTMSGAGVYIPQGFTFQEIVKFALSVLGLTWQNIRQKLVRVVGETAVVAMEQAFDIVMTLVTQGPAAAWDKIQEGIANLREMVMQQVMTFVRDRVVQAAITKLVTSLNPAGAFIQAIIATYNTIMFFVERIRQIGQVVASFIDSISAIAAGNVGSAASRVERTMAGLLTLVISFLARLAGLGRVSDAVVGIINRVRAPIDRALDRVVNWIVTQARRLGGIIRGRDARSPEEKQRDLDRAVRELRPQVEAMVRRGVPRPILQARLFIWKQTYRLTSLTLTPGGLEAAINPKIIFYQPNQLIVGHALMPHLQAARARFTRQFAGPVGPLDVGRALEPNLEIARNRYAADLLAQGSPSAARIAQAGQAIAAPGGGQLPQGMTVGERSVLMTNVLQGNQPLQMTKTPQQRVVRSTITDPTNPGLVFERRESGLYVPGIGRYAEEHVPGMPDPAPLGATGPAYGTRTGYAWHAPDIPAVNRVMQSGQSPPRLEALRETEAVRSPGNLPTMLVGQSLVSAGALTQHDVTYGLGAGMATGGSSRPRMAPSGRPEGGMMTRPSRSGPTGVRQGASGLVFQVLQNTLQSDQTMLLTPQGGGQLVDLAQEFNRWVSTVTANPTGTSTESEEARRLQNSLVAFLHAAGSRR